MEKKSEIIENFKIAISSTVKSLSNSENVQVSFGNQNLNSEKNSVRLPELNQIKDRINYNQIRAMADSKSLKLRYSNNEILRLYEPTGNISKKLYKIAEKIRYEKLGSEEFKGVKNNIENYYQERINSLDFKSDENKIVESFENYLRAKFFNSKNNKTIEKKLKTYKKNLDERFKEKIKKLNDVVHNQAQFNSLISDLISNMNLDENLDNQENENDDNNKWKYIG